MLQRLVVPSGLGMNQWVAFTPFGAGGKGGFDHATLKALDGVFDFDYMGAADFEWGAVPTALSSLRACVKEKRASYGSFLYRSAIPIYFICAVEDKKRVLGAIRRLLKGSAGTQSFRYTGIGEALGRKARPRYVAGWLDIINHFMFFTDETMYKNTLRFLAEWKAPVG
ncbi:MAG: hypothetical protein JRM99_03225 [Nitrososphaerota archaeon]|nr:hypothetical protein [Nitrososphaerota archaeon]